MSAVASPLPLTLYPSTIDSYLNFRGGGGVSLSCACFLRRKELFRGFFKQLTLDKYCRNFLTQIV